MDQPEVSAREFKRFSTARILLPVIIGLTASGLLIFFNLDTKTLARLDWSAGFVFYICLALLSAAVSTACMAYRFMLVSEKTLLWRRAVVLTLLYMFGACVLPLAVVSTVILFALLIKEKVPAGKAIFMTVITRIFDQLFFVIALPALFYLVGFDTLFKGVNITTSVSANSIINGGTKAVFLYGLVTTTIGLAIYCFGLFVSPRLLKRAVQKIFTKVNPAVLKVLDDLIMANSEMKSYGAVFWISGIAATIAIWSFKYLSANFLIAAVSQNADHLAIYAKQMVMYEVMLIIPTPGGSGTAELLFIQMMSAYLNTGVASVIALLWRMVTYYSYIIIGVLILPKWLEEKFFEASDVS